MEGGFLMYFLSMACRFGNGKKKQAWKRPKGQAKIKKYFHGMLYSYSVAIYDDENDDIKIRMI